LRLRQLRLERARRGQLEEPSAPPRARAGLAQREQGGGGPAGRHQKASPSEPEPPRVRERGLARRAVGLDAPGGERPRRDLAVAGRVEPDREAQPLVVVQGAPPASVRARSEPRSRQGKEPNSTSPTDLSPKRPPA